MLFWYVCCFCSTVQIMGLQLLHNLNPNWRYLLSLPSLGNGNSYKHSSKILKHWSWGVQFKLQGFCAFKNSVAVFYNIKQLLLILLTIFMIAIHAHGLCSFHCNCYYFSSLLLTWNPYNLQLSLKYLLYNCSVHRTIKK